MHGYELRQELAGELGPAWSVNYGQVYSTLERLVRDGLCVHSETVAMRDAPDRKLYTVTPTGRGELRRWFLTAVGESEAGREELYAKVVLGLTGDVEVSEVIQAQRKGLLRRMGLLTSLKERLDADLDLTETLHVDLCIAKSDALLSWLDVAEERVKRAAASPVSGVAGRQRIRTEVAEEEASRVQVREEEQA